VAANRPASAALTIRVSYFFGAAALSILYARDAFYQADGITVCLDGSRTMALRNDRDDHGWAVASKRLAGREQKLGLHDYDQPTTDCKGTVLELVTTFAGILGVFLVIIALVKAFA
jgi:hypothetical protein